MRYIIVCETGEVFISNKITEEDKIKEHSGMVHIIDREELKTYHSGKWWEIGERKEKLSWEEIVRYQRGEE